MEQHGNPTVDQLALEYLSGVETGNPASIDELAQQLPDDEARAELRALVETTEWARSTFPEPFRPQQMIADRYTLVDELGIGGFGRVWRARDEHVGRDVAIKLFHSLMEPDQVASTLRRERESLARVSHEGVVRLLDSGKQDDVHFLVMELVDGRSLESLLERLKPLNPGERPARAAVAEALGGKAVPAADSLLDDDWFRTAAQITTGMLRALAATHDQRIFHRDLKPGNVLVRPNGKPVLLDFGLAGLGDEAHGTLTGRLFGTAAYMAPEQLEKMKTGKDASTDLYQCGLLLYELLTFQRAFGDSDRTSVLEAVRRGLATSPRQLQPEVPPELADICMRALERNPERRYSTADEFRVDLERWLAGELPTAARLGTAGRVLRTARRWTVGHRTSAVAAVLVLLGIASTAWFASGGSTNIDARDLGGGKWQLTTSTAGAAFAWLVALDEVGQSLGTYPLRIQIGADKPDIQAALAAGTTTVRVIEDDRLEQDARTASTDVRWFLATDERANDWMQLMRRVALEASVNERVVEKARVREIAEELVAAGRGGGGIGELPLDELLR